MKRYENPIISVSLFDRENVVTDSSQVTQPETEQETAVNQALNAAAKTYGTNVIKVTF